MREAVCGTLAAIAAGCGSVESPPDDGILGAAEIGIGIHHDPSWVKQLGGPGNDEALAIARTAKGVVIAGSTASSWFRPLADVCDPKLAGDHAGEDCGDAFIYDVMRDAGVQFGEAQRDEVKFLAIDGDALYAVGNFREVADAMYQKDAFLLRYPLDLTAEVWRVTIRNPRKVDELIGVAVRGDIYAAGGSNAAIAGHPIEAEDAVVTRVTTAGATVSLQQFGAKDLDETMAIAVDADGVYTIGASGGDVAATNLGRSDVLIVAHAATLDPAAELCRVQFGTRGKDVGQSIIAVGDFLYVVGQTEGRMNGELANGATCNQDDRGGADNILLDAFVSKYDKQCRHIWTREFGTRDSDAASTIASDGTHLYVTGFYGVALAAHDGTDLGHAFLRAYDLDGNVLGEVVFDSSAQGAATTEIGQSVAVDDNFVYVAGGTDGTLGAANLGGKDAFVAAVPRAALLGNAHATGDGCD